MGLPNPPPLGTAMLPPGTYAGEVVMITGGGTGLGKVMAEGMLLAGAEVISAGDGAACWRIRPRR